jgi:hypothetical protein
MPFAGLMQRVNAKHGTPGATIWTVVVAGLAAMVWAGAVPIVTSLSTVALYLAYIIPVALGLRSRLRGSDWLGLARWTLGRWGPAVNLVAALYTLFICCVLIMPPNQLAAKTLAGVLGALGVIYVVEVRRKYRGPIWALELDRSFVRVHGVLRTHREFLQAVSRRFLGAPTRLAWSHANRTASFRLVGVGPSLRIECRIPGADCNPYLCFAAALASGLDGIANKMEPPPVFEGDAYAAGILPCVPASLREAVALFKSSPICP